MGEAAAYERKAAALAAVRNDIFGFALGEPPAADFRGDKDVVLAAVRSSGHALQLADPSLQADKEVVLASVKRAPGGPRSLGHGFRFADERLQADRDFVLEVVRESGTAMKYAAKWVRGDKEVVMTAVKSSEDFCDAVLYNASAAMQACKEVVITAVRLNGLSLEHADAALRADKEVVMEAVRKIGGALEFADPALQADKEVVTAAVQGYGCALEFASPALRANKEVVLAAVMEDGSALRFADVSLHRDADVVLAAVPSCGIVLCIESDATFIRGLLASLAEHIVINIITLSGRSCWCICRPPALPAAPGVWYDDWLREHVLMRSAAVFGLEARIVLDSGVLLEPCTATTMDNDEALLALERGQIHELQLIVQDAKRRRL